MGEEEQLGEGRDWEILATNLRVQEALLGVVDLLDGIPLVVFKGPVLTQMIYGDLRRRASADNDIWVRESHIASALERLLAAGYEPSPGLDARAAIRRVGQVDLFRGSDPAVDLHLHPFSSRFFNVKTETLDARLMTVEVGGVQLRTFNEALAFVHMVAHFVQHHFELRVLDDLKAAWKAWGGDSRIREEIGALAPYTCTLAALELTLHLIDECEGSFNHIYANDSILGIPIRLFPMSGRVRAGVVRSYLRSTAPSSLLLQFCALFLVRPHRLPMGLWNAIFLEDDDLVSRYGSGARKILLFKHVWRKMRD